MLVLNNELRFSLVSLLDGVVFFDVGNIFPEIEDFTFSDLRESAGVGLRIRTRWVLVRLDLVFPHDRRHLGFRTARGRGPNPQVCRLPI